jgi:hypothetical protein
MFTATGNTITSTPDFLPTHFQLGPFPYTKLSNLQVSFPYQHTLPYFYTMVFDTNLPWEYTQITMLRLVLYGLFTGISGNGNYDIIQINDPQTY